MLKYRLWALFFFFLSLVIFWFVYSSETNPQSSFKFKKGLDLESGSHLTYLADVSEINPREINNAMDTLRQTIEKRINIFGVSEPIVQTERSGMFSGDKIENRLIVELPGVTDVQEAVKQIGKTPILEFKLAKASEELDLEKIVDFATGTDEINIDDKDLYSATGLTGASLSKADLTFDQMTREPVISVTFNTDGTKLLSDITEKNIGKNMAIFLDGNMISSPVIQAHITNGQAIITGNFKLDEARELVKNLKFGALPVPIKLIETQTIGPTLGVDTLNKGSVALLAGFIIVSIFLIVYYRFAGFLVSLALFFYVVIMLGLFKLIPVTLTASGLAGFIMSVGMAVDANVLIFERIKEELKTGESLFQAITNGVRRAWLSIRDGNMTSIIAAIILYWLSGTSVVRGFALVFALGVLVSMFTAVIVSKMLLMAFASKNKNLPWERFFIAGYKLKEDNK